MQHKRVSSWLGMYQTLSCSEIARIKLSSFSKYWLCIFSLRSSFQTRSIGLSSGLYGGKIRSSSRSRCRSRKASRLAEWWYAALSIINNILRPLVRYGSRCSRYARKLSASNIDWVTAINLPVRTFTAPNNAIDFLVGAWRSVGFLSSGGTHMTHRDPCC